MLLIDSYGNEKDCIPKIMDDDTIEKYVEFGVNICPDFDIEVHDDRNVISYSRNVTFPATDFRDARDMVLSIEAFINPCDNEVCKVRYLETSKDAIEKGLVCELVTGKGWLRDSLLCEELAPEMGELMDAFIKECDLKNRNESAYDKTMYELAKTLPFKYEDLWSKYSEIKKSSTRCRYDRANGSITADGEEYLVRGDYLLHNGKIYHSFSEIETNQKEKSNGERSDVSR